ncbi:MAG: MFS transporter [Chitinophagales bacterium]
MLDTTALAQKARRRAVPAVAAVTVLALGHTVVDLYGTSITPLLPRFVQLWHLTPASLGLLTAATSLTGSLLQPVLGFYLDRKGSSRLAALSVLWISVAVLALGWVTSFPLLFALATATILGSAVYHPLGAALARRVAPLNRRGFYISLYMNVGTLGWAVAPLLVTWWVSSWGLKALAWLALPGLAVAALLVAAGLSLASPDPAADLPPPAAARQAPAPAAPRPAPAGLGRLRRRGVYFLLACTILRSWAASAVQTYLPTHLVQQGQSLTAAGGVLTLFTVSGTVAGFFFGYLSDRFGRRALIAVTQALAGAALFWLLKAPPAFHGVATALTGILMLGSLPLTVVLIQEMMPGRASTGAGLVIGFAGGIGGLLVLASGYLANRVGLGTALLWTVPALPAAALCALAIPEQACRLEAMAETNS